MSENSPPSDLMQKKNNAEKPTSVIVCMKTGRVTSMCFCGLAFCAALITRLSELTP